MTPERWQRVKDLFEAALEREPTMRPAFLARAAADDPTLAEAVLGLLASDDRARGFLSGPPSPSGSAAGPPEEPPPSLEGRRLGPYRLLAEIGQGGMGAVYRAVRDDDQYRKQVAIKLIRGGWDSGFVRGRFKTERQILANLEHPNIARLLDGGNSDEGWPYLVMEYVEGQPVDRYCEAHELGLVERLQLFRIICAAVQHAHRNLVVHRDIKPGNILVTPEGTPKLLDFGIAKLLDPGGAGESSPATLTGFPLMTPAYASPEQVRGEPITTASDVYSLGVLLYELLAGARPYEVTGRSPGEILKVVCEAEPIPPSAAARRRLDTARSVGVTRGRELQVDLDAIALKALSKEPDRRYGSAEELSQDIQRHLDGLPVRARKDSVGYRAGKFVRRHKAAVAGATVAVASLLAATAVAVGEARVARAQRVRAERRFNDVRKLANSFVFEVHDSIENLEGATKARETIVKRALEYLDSLAREASDDVSLLKELAAAYERVGDAQSGRANSNLGDAKGALDSQRKALAIRSLLSAGRPDDVDAQHALVDSYLKVARLLRDTGRAAEALANGRQALAALGRTAPERGDPQRQLQAAKSYGNVSRMLYAAGDPASAEEAARKQIDILERAIGAHPQAPDGQRDLAAALAALGDVQLEAGRWTEALQTFQRALPLAEAAIASEPRNPTIRYVMLVVYERMGDVLTQSNDLDGAVEMRRKSLDLVERDVAADAHDARARFELFVEHYKMGTVLSARKDWKGALASQRRALAVAEPVVAADPGDSWKRYLLAGVHFEIGEDLLGAGDFRHALEAYRRGLAIDERLNEEDPTDAEYRETLAETYTHMAHALTRSGDPAAAVDLLEKAKAIWEPLLAAGPNAKRRAGLAWVYGGLGEARARLPGRANEACSWYGRSVAAWTDLEAQGPLSPGDAEAASRAAQGQARCRTVEGPRRAAGR